MPRDDFPSNVINIPARRVGMQCSNPNCRQPTSGPQDDPGKAINVGVAAHITAASAKGPRFDDTISPEERRSIENGIWLCQNCAKLVDNDPSRYPIDLLRQWRRLSEEAARLAIESPHAEKENSSIKDMDLIRFYSQCFDRPAFQDLFLQEGSMEAFDKAIEDTITAINTGCLRSRDGGILSHSQGKAFLNNICWRQQMDIIVDLLRAIRSRYEGAKRNGQIHVNERSDGDSYYCFHDSELADWMDSTRAEVLRIFADVCSEAGMHPPVFPRHRSPRWWR